MAIPFIPIIVICLGGAAYHTASKRSKSGIAHGVLTAKRAEIYETAIRENENPEALRKLAKAFREAGLPTHAIMLEKRADLRSMPEDVKQKRRLWFKKAMKSTDVNGIRALANAFQKEGCTGAAEALNKYAASLPPVPLDGTPIPVKAAEPPKAEAPKAEAPKEADQPLEQPSEQDTVVSADEQMADVMPVNEESAVEETEAATE